MNDRLRNATTRFEFFEQPRANRVIADRYDEAKAPKPLPVDRGRRLNRYSCQLIALGLIVDHQRRIQPRRPRRFNRHARMSARPIKNQAPLVRLLRIHGHSDSSDITLGHSPVERARSFVRARPRGKS